MSQPVFANVRIAGLVQGIGFRPHIWKLAKHFNLRGEVKNDSTGVLLDLYGQKANILEFVEQLKHNPPQQARYTHFDLYFNESTGHKKIPGEFIIQQSSGGQVTSPLPPDIALCENCKKEVLQANNARAGYALISCAQCGPRYSILNKAPYDRAHTSMASFPLCDFCQNEFLDVNNRRFHAETIACCRCGPSLSLIDKHGKSFSYPDQQCLQIVAESMMQGSVVCVKGLTGFHFLCDAMNEQAIEKIRQLKRRPHKALALLAKDIDMIKHYAEVDQLEEAALLSAQAPVLLLQKKVNDLPENIASQQSHHGFVLPYTGIHTLLMQQMPAPLVFTSANTSGRAQCYVDEEAINTFAGEVDYLLLHNREILQRCDDSVMKKSANKIIYFRRARGAVPVPISLPSQKNTPQKNVKHFQTPKILALGAESHSSVSLVNDCGVVASGYLGDLKNHYHFQDFRQQVKHLCELHDFTADYVVVDKHPDYASTQFGLALAKEREITLLSVQHHHAHMASCLLDNAIANDEQIYLGLILDGSGYGEDGNMWGAECLLGSYTSVKRVAHFKALALPGGDIASKQPWRMLYSCLTHCDINRIFTNYGELPVLKKLALKPVAVLNEMLVKDINCPRVSSAGRLFDAAAAALDVCFEENLYEAQAAMALESLAFSEFENERVAYPFAIDTNQVDWSPLWPALLSDLLSGIAPAVVAARFHRSLIEGLFVLCSETLHTSQVSAVILSGGVFQNVLLQEGLQKKLQAAGHKVYTHQQLPANDGGISAGQAAVAYCRLTQG